MIEITEELQEIRDMVADFSRNELSKRAQGVDADSAFPTEAIQQLSELGLLGAPLPENYGGTDGSTLMMVLILEQLARSCASTAAVLSTHVLEVALAIFDQGTDEQRQKYLPRLATGELLGSFALAEHGAEADAAAVSCRATREGDDWVLDGIKKYVIAGAEAGLYLVVAHTEGSHGTGDLALFIVDGGAQASGVRIVGVEDALGLRGARVAEVAFEECRIGSDALLGADDHNFDGMQNLLSAGRIGAAAIACGVASGALDYARGYAAQRRAFGKTIDKLEALRNMFADGATQIEAARLLTYRAASMRDRGEPCAAAACMAKLFASESGYSVAKNAVQILGGNGYSREYPVERMYRDAKTLEVVEATGELHRRLIARDFIGDH